MLDEKTVRIHHDKHHAAYVAGANFTELFSRGIRCV